LPLWAFILFIAITLEFRLLNMQREILYFLFLLLSLFHLELVEAVGQKQKPRMVKGKRKLKATAVQKGNLMTKIAKRKQILEEEEELQKEYFVHVKIEDWQDMDQYKHLVEVRC
jgi:hypothetical protein